ncbi:terpenoid synthase [Auricularia subglabra TFB-10046 SS5]|nr:terpenoid synthase [Auricularia subglabra TFB-10046 SS5]
MDTINLQTNVLHLPDLLSLCEGFTARRSTHYGRAAAETRAWMESHNALGANTCAVFAAADMELLAARCYPSAPYTAFRPVCDFLCLLIVLDEVCDAQTGAEASKTGASFVETLRDPTCGDGTTVAALTMEFRERLGDWVRTEAFVRFVDACEKYVAATAREAELRERGEVLDLDSYQALRRENSAMRPCLCIMEFALGLSLPDRVYKDEHFSTVYWAVGDMVCWANDIYSYRAERAAGLEGNNYMTVLMKEKNFSLQQAGDYVGQHFKRLVGQYFSARDALREDNFGDPELDQAVAHLTTEMANWVIGNIIWSLECRRYFGEESEEVKKTRCVRFGRVPPSISKIQNRN